MEGHGLVRAGTRGERAASRRSVEHVVSGTIRTSASAATPLGSPGSGITIACRFSDDGRGYAAESPLHWAGSIGGGTGNNARCCDHEHGSVVFGQSGPSRRTGVRCREGDIWVV